jgi:hypothetical protein
LPWWYRTLGLSLRRFDLVTYAAFDSCSKEALVERQQVWWLIAIMLAIEAFDFRIMPLEFATAPPRPRRTEAWQAL